MPKFYFDVVDHEITLDDEGQDLPSSAAAIEEAYRGARSLAATAVLDGHLNLKHRIIVRDEQGTVAEVPFRRAVTLDS